MPSATMTAKCTGSALTIAAGADGRLHGHPRGARGGVRKRRPRLANRQCWARGARIRGSRRRLVAWAGPRALWRIARPTATGALIAPWPTAAMDRGAELGALGCRHPLLRAGKPGVGCRRATAIQSLSSPPRKKVEARPHPPVRDTAMVAGEGGQSPSGARVSCARSASNIL